ncbi:MAG: universal stress protein [Marivibrio sp.]|uniref:universal stress protein n=1 Tax=Marivibrio sp. TaxID=2039719 RepID=UPI0032EDA0D8
MMSFQRILYAAKQREWAEHASAHVRDLALALGAEVIVLRVTETQEEQVALAKKVDRDAQAGVAQRRSAVDLSDHKTAEAIVEALSEDGISARVEIRQGRVAEEILHAAEALEVDLIAIGSARRGALTALVTASVPSEIVRRAVRPVLVIPDPTG